MASKEIITMKRNFRSRLASKENYNQRCNFTTNPLTQTHILVEEHKEQRLE